MKYSVMATLCFRRIPQSLKMMGVFLSVMLSAPTSGGAVARVAKVHPAAPAPATAQAAISPPAPLKNELNPLFRGEAVSSLLPDRWDALRDSDMTDPYFIPAQASGHLIPQLQPFRSRLAQYGVAFNFTYKGEAMANINGGQQRGMDYVHELTLQVNFDLERMAGLKGWTIHTLVMERVGREVSRDRVGEPYINLMEVYGLSGHSVAHLVDFYAEKKFLNNRADITFGRMSLTHVFATSPLICSFMVTCSAPVALKLDAGFAVYPKATWGARFRLRPTRDTMLQVGAYNVAPLASNPSGWAWGSEPSTGLMLPVEFTWQPFLGRDRLPGHYVLGFAHDTTRYADSLGAVPAALAEQKSSAPRDSVWIMTDQMIYRAGGHGQMDGGYLMAGYLHNTPHVSTIADEVYVGGSFPGFIPSRPKDRIGVLYSWYHVSDRLYDGQAIREQAGLPLGAMVLAPQTNSSVIEAYYGFAPMQGITLQPEFQYMIRPGETARIPDAALVGLKVIATL
ncbi:carbohydrate porin [Gluconacetobacter azotocaptans]|uniref:Carbohydrate porin n=2 Tax=Gluconacetobacter azotocaptans TaxID=142834 RepID=A0A7W4JPI3_9PROT|nr:carbohydrate porin [Gluconacetobacter azotocaptans]MBM9400264.1 carbohydrate porin [Gluconacetobacter azotocaptans]